MNKSVTRLVCMHSYDRKGSNMGRINRIWYPGATYHVMCRGNRRGDIFREEEDYVTYLRIVSIARTMADLAGRECIQIDDLKDAR